MSFATVNLQDWEKLVAKQLKTDDIYSVLVKENIEGIEVKPYYTSENAPLVKLTRSEENMHLVASYSDYLVDDAFAFFIKNQPVQLKDKAYFYVDSSLNTLATDTTNRYFCIKDIFDDSEVGSLDKIKVEELLRSNAERKIGVDISLHQNAGASIVQQLAVALLKAKELIEEFGISILDQIVFRTAIGSQYFLEIAKIRALRILVNQLAKEYDHHNVPYIFAETSFRNKSIVDSENNLIRSTLELASAMVGGADAVFANDYKIGANDTVSEETSFKQQIVLAYESIINVFEDASSGSYFVENATKEIAEKAWDLFVSLEEKGGFLAIMKSGELQKEIYNHALKEQQWVDEGKIKLIGVNLYPTLEVQKEISELYSKNQIKPVRLAERYGV